MRVTVLLLAVSVAWFSGAQIPNPDERADATAVQGMPGNVRELVNQITVPVLLPPTWPIATVLIARPEGYSLMTRLQSDATLSIDASRVSVRAVPAIAASPDGTVHGAPAYLTVGEGLAAVAWFERGTGYKLALDCASDDDARCHDASPLIAMALSLVHAGGPASTTPQTRPLADGASRATQKPSATKESGSLQFTYEPAGELVQGSGTGQPLYQDLVPPIRFPLAKSPAYANSQVWGKGGKHGGGGGQCDVTNYSYPWRDNFCETRAGRKNIVCPAKTGHQGQDIRPATCKRNLHAAVAVTTGTITNIGKFSVWLTDHASGSQFRYLHMDSLKVKEQDDVRAGDALGSVSDRFDGTPTTVHLHFESWVNVENIGFVPVGPYTALIAAYERLLASP